MMGLATVTYEGLVGVSLSFRTSFLYGAGVALGKITVRAV